MTRETAGIGFTVIAACAYASIDVTVKLAYRGELNVPTMLAVRSIGAGLLLLLLGQALAVAPRPSMRHVYWLIALGGLGYATASFLVNSALDQMSVGPVILILFLYPTIVAVTAVLIGREGIGVLKLAVLVLSIIGLAILLSFPTEAMNVPGIFLALGAALAFAAYTLVAEWAIVGVHSLLFSGFVLLGAGTVTAILGASTGSLHLMLPAASWSWLVLHLGLISVAVVASIGAITRLGATRASVGNTLEPALAVVFATVILGDQLGLFQVLGGVILVIAVALLPFVRTASASRPERSVLD